MPEPVPDAVTAAWDATVAAWDEPKRHEALLALVTQYNCFVWVAGRYRERAGDPIADVQLERIRKAATATLFATAAPRSETPRRNTMLLLVLLLVMVIMIGLGLGIVRMMSHGHHDDTDTTTDDEH